MLNMPLALEPYGDAIVVVGLVDRGTHVEARLQNWRLLKPGDRYYRMVRGELVKTAKRGKA